MVEKMDQLLEYYRSSKPPVKAQKEYQESWLALARRDGLAGSACDYLLAGSRFRSGDAFCVLWKDSAEPLDLVRTLTESPAAPVSSRSQQLALLLRVLAHLLNSGAPAAQLALLIEAVAQIAQSPAGGYVQYADVKVRDELLGLFRPGSQLPAYASLSLPPEAGRAFARMLSDLTAKTAGKLWSAAKLDARSRLLEWTAETVGTPAASAKPAAEPAGSYAGKLTAAVSLVQEIIPYLQSLEQQVREAHQREAALPEKPASPGPEGEADSALRARIAQLEDELAANAELIEVIQRDNQATAADRTEALEEALEQEYEDFRGAEEQPMSDLLGENLRDQLRKVFGLLRDHGLNF